jgi:hypothetical protein
MDARTDDRGGLGRRNRPRKTPKGRQVDPTALEECARCWATASAGAIS